MNKKKYWYITELTVCVHCGREVKHKYRVYIKPKQSIKWIDDACHTHFI